MAKAQATAEEIYASLGDALDQIDVFHAQVLVAMFIRPEKTDSGVWLSDQTRHEDTYQGKAGLVLKMGPLAYKPSANIDFTGSVVQVGDWVGFRTSDGFLTQFNGVICRLIDDVAIKCRIASPKIIY